MARRKIKDLPLEDRPRERLLVEGSETLSKEGQVQ